jgi:hypothetical protein
MSGAQPNFMLGTASLSMTGDGQHEWMQDDLDHERRACDVEVKAEPRNKEF